MNKLLLGAVFAASSVVMSFAGSAQAADGVWKDAYLRIRGAVDRNNDGLWTSNDFTSANTEIPNVVYATTEAPASAKIVYNVAQHADSNVRIMNETVKLSSEGREVVRPVLYFPQTEYLDGSTHKARLQCLNLFNGERVDGNGGKAGTYKDWFWTPHWTAVFRLKPEVLKLQTGTKGTCNFLNMQVQGNRNELRLGVRTEDGGQTGSLWLMAGSFSQLLDTLPVTTDWLEVSMVVSGRVIRFSCGRPGCLRRWYECTISSDTGPSGDLTPRWFTIGGIKSRTASESCDGGNADSFRGWVETVGIWRRALTDAEVVEAFGGANPSIVSIGEEGVSAKMFAGAKATGAVTLDPTVHDQRPWPASYGAGAEISIPFRFDTYSYGSDGVQKQALRVVSQPGSAGALFRVRIDGKRAGYINLPACASDGTPVPQFLELKTSFFTQMNSGHTLTLTCESADGDVKLDNVQICGSWRVGDTSTTDISTASDMDWVTSKYTASESASRTSAFQWHDAFYAASRSMKDFNPYLGDRVGIRRDKVIWWNVPKGLPTHADYRMSIRLTGAKSTIVDKNVLVKVNGETIKTVNITGTAGFWLETDVPAGALKDGLNEIRIAIDSPARDDSINVTSVNLQMKDCTTDWKPGFSVLIR